MKGWFLLHSDREGKRGCVLGSSGCPAERDEQHVLDYHYKARSFYRHY